MASKPIHKATFEDLKISPYQASLLRECELCKLPYTIDTHSPWEWTSGAMSFAFRSDCDRWCLACLLGVGPVDFPDDETVGENNAARDGRLNPAAKLEQARTSINRLEIGPGHQEWPRHSDAGLYEAQCGGQLLKAYSFFTEKGIPLVIMPLTQAFSDRAVHYPNGITYYPPGAANLEGLDRIEEIPDSTDLAARSSSDAGATIENLMRQGVLVFPASLDAQLIAKADHGIHLDLIRRLSEEVDKVCLNFVRYYTCTLDRLGTIPSRPGQTEADPGMSICLIYDPRKKTSRIYGGAAFSFAFTGGIGIWLSQPEWQNFPGKGEVGKIVYHALGLYSTMLETSSDTTRFVQALSLLEFLAFPSDYAKMMEVKKVVARYVAADQKSYDGILERFKDLTGNKDPLTGEEKGLRTRVIHIGERIESLIPFPEQRRELFAELDGYIRAVMNHMIQHSEIDFEQYAEIRKSFPAFLVQTSAGTH